MRAELDVVAIALVAEADVQRDHAPVREALRRLREVGRRVENDGGVLRGQVHEGSRPPARRIAPTISSRSWSFVRQATAPASSRAFISRRFAEAVSATTLVPGQLATTALVAWTPSSPGQPIVHHDDVGLVLDARGHGEGAFGHRRDDVDVVAEAEQQLERLAEDLVVLHEDDADPAVRHSAESRSG